MADSRAIESLIRALDDTSRSLCLGLPYVLPCWPFGTDLNFVAEAAAKALEAILQVCPKKLGDNNLRLLAFLPHKQKVKVRLVDDTFQTFYGSFQKITYKVEERHGPDCRNIRALANLELSRRMRLRIKKGNA